MRKTTHGRKVTVPEGVHPFVKFVFASMREQHLGYGVVQEEAGVHHGLLSGWRGKYGPNIVNLEAVLNVLGYRLAILPRHEATTTHRGVKTYVRPNDLARPNNRRPFFEDTRSHSEPAETVNTPPR